MVLPLRRQGNKLVLRTDSGTVKAHATVQRADDRPETWRRALSKLTNGGRDMHKALLDLMYGNAYTPRFYDRDGKEDLTRTCDPIIPTPEVRRACAKDLHEMLHGKAVAETEVRVSEREAEKKLQLESMSDEQLQQFIDGEYKELTGGEDISGNTPQEDGTHATEDVEQRRSAESGN